MPTLYIAWQDPENRQFFPVGLLTYEEEQKVYRFVYTRGAEESPSFAPFLPMKELHAVYESEELFPLFTNRILHKKRPEYPDFLTWLDVPRDHDDPMVLLARSGGLRATDPFMVFPCPIRENKIYHIDFFIQRLCDLPQEALDRIDRLEVGTELYCMLDPQNSDDPSAVALRMPDRPILVGYCPQYLSRDLFSLLKRNGTGGRFTVERINHDAPFQLRLRCHMSSEGLNEFHPCSDEAYDPLVHLPAQSG